MKTKNKILLVVLSCLLVALLALPASAYEVYPSDADVAGYISTPIFWQGSIDDTIYGDITPQRIASDDSMYSLLWGTPIFEENDDVTFYAQSDEVPDVTVSFPHLVYNSSGVATTFRIGEADGFINFEIYSLDGRYIDSGRHFFVSNIDNNLEFDVTAYLDSLVAYYQLPSAIIHFSLDVTQLRTDGYVRLSLVDGSDPLASLMYRPLTTQDTIVNTTIDNVPVADFLWDSISGFLSFELAPNLQLYHILLAVVAFPLLVWFLKVVAGG